ncbi:MAG: hypothetical protein IJ048_06440 [Clostridia bacterium]|nr:hypothetical protein [Clostridia bacterium]
MDMQGYDRKGAAAFMLPKLNKAEFKPLAGDVEALIQQAMDADFAYMADAGILAADGTMGEAYYDDDDAFEFILDHMARARRAKEKDMDALAAFVDQYMELQEQYLSEAGLLSWD